jgi:peptidoglycan/LPS O-acetylase OafA/YrhL
LLDKMVTNPPLPTTETRGAVATEPADTTAVRGAGRARLFFADHLRAALVTLVVLHHLAVIYGAGAPFYYVEPPYTDGAAFLTLLLFILVNQGYFMGLLFGLAGYFTPGSFDRKGARPFLRDRGLRLLVPLFAFVLVLNPIAMIGVYQMPSRLTGITEPFGWSSLSILFGVGPLWFVEVLCFLTIGYIAWRALRPARGPREEVPSSRPSYRAIGLFVIALAVTTYLLRIVVPIGFAVPVLGLPTPAYLPQYVSFFVLGAVAFRRDWFRTIPGSMGRVGLAVALAATVLLFLPALGGGSAFLGHGTWQSAAYAMWDSTFSVGISLALITFFRHSFNRESRLGRFLSEQSYTVYIIHTPLIVLLALALRGLHPEQLLKFALASAIAVPLCFGAAWLVRRLPHATRVL